MKCGNRNQIRRTGTGGMLCQKGCDTVAGQKVITDYMGLTGWIRRNACRNVLLVCGGSVRHMEAFGRHLKTAEEAGIKIISFGDFQSNPRYESVVKGVELFRRESCDSIIAVGGGSAMDVAKCIKAYAGMDGSGENGDYLKQRIVPNDIPFLAVPTTAGTGSEATRYAVIYYKGQKQSVTGESLIPGTVLLDPDALKTLPLYQRKATMMDALCHAVESFWSVNSTEESKEYSREAIQGILAHMDGYLQNTGEGNAGMMMAAHTAGKAINVTQTTAGHAMCYKITSLFGCAHGHAAILCDRILYPWMVENTDKCIDPRGREYLAGTLDGIGQAMGCRNAREGAGKLQEIFWSLGLKVPEASGEQFRELAESVNPVRLRNHPIVLDDAAISELYHEILG